VADFYGTPTSGTEPLTVDFTDQSTGSIDTWSWTFGDGGTSSAQNPSHTYTSAGTYTVTLTVTGPGGSDDEVKVD
jgi:PKD repeat protein